MSGLPDPICIVFTRNWIDPTGEERGFRWTRTSGDEAATVRHCQELRENPIAKVSEWEYVVITPDQIMSLADD
jgi:hypothetical protein